MRIPSVGYAVLLTVLASVPLHGQTRIITGTVTDSLTSEAVTSGQVAVQGATVTGSIQEDGTFTVAVPTREVTLVIRSIGFKRRDLVVPADQNTVSVALARDYFQLEAIVVTGQATGVEKRNLANAVATVSAEELVKAPSASVEQSLQGKLSGANISQNSGAPGGGMLVRLRGVTSIIGTFTPLYVVDGVIVSDAAIYGGSNMLRRANTAQGIAGNQDNPVNRIADLNPNDIESVEVLKGASASAIYGSKASNGVIIITTKKGRVGAPQFSLTQRVGVSHIIPRAYIGARRFASADEAEAVFGPQGRADYLAANGAFFDNERALVGGTPVSNETSASVNGGTETTRYFASGLIKHDGGIVKNTFGDKQSLRLNIDQSIGGRLSIGLATEAIHTAADRGLTDNENNGVSWYSSLSATPSFFDLRQRPSGDCGVLVTCLPPGNFPRNPYQSSNPLQSVELVKNREAVWRILLSTRASLDLISNATSTLRIVGTAGGDIFTQKNNVFAPPEAQFEPNDGLLGTSVLSFSQSQNFNVNGNAVYVYKTGGSSATTQVGVQYETRNLNISRTMAENLVGGLNNLRSGTALRVEQDLQLIKDFGVFAQEEFLTLDERLLLTAGLRADQSSNNGDPDKLFYYPKASVSYRLPLLPGVLDEVKLRAALGFSGNQPKYGQKFTELEGGNISGIPVARINAAGITGAADIKPERQREIEGGFDATLFGSRGNFEFTVYEKRVEDLLLTRTLAPTTGLATQYFNGGVLRTRGLEMALNVLPVQRSNFQWNVRGTFSLNRCTIVSLPVPAFRPISFLNSNLFGSTFIEPDSSCTQIYGNDTLGAVPGDEARGPAGTRLVRRILDANPDYRFSIANDLTYKGVRLYFLFDRQKGGVLANFTGLLYCLNQNCEEYTTPRNGITGAERAGAFSKTARVAFEDASYLKLRELTLSVDLPRRLVSSIWGGLRYARVGISGRNLLTFTPYTGSDPESNEIQRSAAEGIPWEIWAYPPSRSVFFTLDLGF